MQPAGVSGAAPQLQREVNQDQHHHHRLGFKLIKSLLPEDKLGRGHGLPGRQLKHMGPRMPPRLSRDPWTLHCRGLLPDRQAQADTGSVRSAVLHSAQRPSIGVIVPARSSPPTLAAASGYR